MMTMTTTMMMMTTNKQDGTSSCRSLFKMFMAFDIQSPSLLLSSITPYVDSLKSP